MLCVCNEHVWAQRTVLLGWITVDVESQLQEGINELNKGISLGYTVADSYLSLCVSVSPLSSSVRFYFSLVWKALGLV